LRDGKLELSPAIIDALLNMVDELRGLLNEIVESGAEGSGDY